MMSERNCAPAHPLAEVFGYPVDNHSAQAERARRNRLCCYNNRVPNCTKDKAENPLGVCSVFDKNHAVITCPVRFRQDWLVAEDASRFFFPEGTHWTSLSEVRLNEADGVSAGNIDVVLVSYDDSGRLTDFGALEIQAVYISGNVRRPFESYMANPGKDASFAWIGEPNYPRPDYLSSSRKRLAPQLLFKGGIIHSWGKKTAVALDEHFFATLPPMPETGPSSADIAWLIYGLVQDDANQRFVLQRKRTVYTEFGLSLNRITIPRPGPVAGFVAQLQAKLNEKLDNPPDMGSLDIDLRGNGE